MYLLHVAESSLILSQTLIKLDGDVLAKPYHVLRTCPDHGQLISACLGLSAMLITEECNDKHMIRIDAGPALQLIVTRPF